MAKNDNLKDFLTDLYEGIVSKKPNASRNPQDFRSEIESIHSSNAGARIIDYEVGDLEGTTVPNDGTKVDKIYFHLFENNNSIEEYISNANLTFIPIDGRNVYPFLFDVNTYDAYIIYNYNVNSYSILRMNFINQEDTTLYYSTESGILFENFEYEAAKLNLWINLSNTVLTVNEFQGIPVGTENYKIKEMFSITPFRDNIPYTVANLEGDYKNEILSINDSVYKNALNFPIVQLLPYIEEKKIITKIYVNITDTIENLNTDDLSSSIYLKVRGKIKDYLFYNTLSVSCFDLPYATIIGTRSFYEARFSTINIPKVERILDEAFRDSLGYKNIYLPVCRSIGGSAFKDAEDLTDMYLGFNQIVTLEDYEALIMLGDNILNVHIRPELVEAYQDATNWSVLIAEEKIRIIGDYTDE